MTTKNVLGIITVVGLLAIATAAFAGWGGGRGFGGGYGSCPFWGNGPAQTQQLTPEQQEKYTALQAEYDKKVQPISDELWAKHTELRALHGNSNVKPEYITQLVGEIKELRTKLDAARTEHVERVEKEVGVKPFGPGYGPRGRGMMRGGGFGPDMMRDGGFGPGMMRGGYGIN